MKRKIRSAGISIRLRGLDVTAARKVAAELPSALASCRPRVSGLVSLRMAGDTRPKTIACAVARAISGDEE